MPIHEKAIGLIFRIPEKGKVKTRLAKEIGENKAYEFYCLMLNEVIQRVLAIKDVDLIGFYKGDKRHFNCGFRLFKQKGNDLGRIIENAIFKLKDIGYKRIVIIGSDSPDVPINFISNAFKFLENFDFVIGPALDGGFYLLALKDLPEGMFYEINWGTDSVLEKLIQNIVEKKKTFYLLPEWYDIDDLETLNKWIKFPIPS